MADKKEIIYADNLRKAIVDDVDIRGAAFAAVMRHLQAATAVDAVEVPPIKIGDMTKQIDDDIYRVVQNYSINVDKHELFRALKYDRNQYEKGYADGVREFAERIFEAFPSDMNYTTISRFLVKTILNGMVGTIGEKGERENESVESIKQIW